MNVLRFNSQRAQVTVAGKGIVSNAVAPGRSAALLMERVWRDAPSNGWAGKHCPLARRGLQATSRRRLLSSLPPPRSTRPAGVCMWTTTF